MKTICHTNELINIIRLMIATAREPNLSNISLFGMEYHANLFLPPLRYSDRSENLSDQLSCSLHGRQYEQELYLFMLFR